MSKETTMKREVKFWAAPDTERLVHTDFDEAVEDILDGMEPTPIAELPETIEVAGFARAIVPLNVLYKPLEDIIERLDEDYGDPEGEYFTESTDTMREAQAQFLQIVRDEYQKQCWACDAITRVTVDVQSWIAEHAPRWLEEA